MGPFTGKQGSTVTLIQIEENGSSTISNVKGDIKDPSQLEQDSAPRTLSVANLKDDQNKNLTAEVLQEQRREKTPFFYCRWIVAHPKRSFFITLGIQVSMFVISGILFLSGFNLFPTSFDTLPVDVYSVPYKLRDNAFRDKDQYDNKFTRQLADTGYPSWERGLRFALSSVKVYYDTENGNVVTKSNLQTMKQVEDGVISASGYDQYCTTANTSLVCVNPVSILRYFDGTYSSINAVFDDPNFNNIPAVLYEAYTNTHTKDEFEYFLPKTYTLTATTAIMPLTRTIIPIGCSLSGSMECGDVASELHKPFLGGALKDKLEQYRESVETMNIYYYSYNLWVTDVVTQAMKDIMFAIGSMVFIFSFMVFHTQSLWISGFAVMSIISSFLGGNLLYRVVVGFRYFGFFHILAIFIVLGIGADDLFVFYDAWRLTAFASYPSLAHRLSDAYSKSAFSMLITSLTTIVAFLCNAVSPLLATKSFGVFSALVVLFNYMSVIIFFPTVIVMYHLKFENFKWPCIQFCKRKCKKTNPGDEMSDINKETVKNNAISPEPDKKHISVISVGKESGIKADLQESNNTKVYDGLTDSQMNGIAGVGSNAINGTAVGNGSHEKGNNTDNSVKTSKKARAKQKRLVVFFRDRYFKFVTHKIIRWCLFPVFIVVVAFFSYQAAQLEPDNENMKVWKDSHYYTKAVDHEQYEFQSSGAENMVTVYVAWGLKNNDRSDCHFSAIDCDGDNVYDDNFDPNPTANQQALIDFCNNLYNLTDSEINNYEIKKDSSGNVEVACFTRNLQTFLNGKASDHGIDLTMPLDWTKIQNLMTSESTDFDVSQFNSNYPNLLLTAIQYWMYNGYDMNFTTDYGMYNSFFGEQKGSWSQQLKSDSTVYYGNKMKYMVVAINTTINRFTTGYTEGIPKVEKWESFISDQVNRMPNGLQGGFQLTRNIWHWLYAQKELEKNAILGISIGLSLAFPILCIATMNYIVGGLATLSICCTTVSVIGVIPLAGWKLGPLTSLNMCMLVGLAVDYVVHLAEGYRNSLHKDRINRTRDMLEDMGTSVFSGACTTLGASLFMFLAKITFFMQFGVFMFCTIGFSLFFSLGLFTVLVGIIGPENNTGSIQPLIDKIKKCFRWCRLKCKKSPIADSDQKT